MRKSEDLKSSDNCISSLNNFKNEKVRKRDVKLATKVMNVRGGV